MPPILAAIPAIMEVAADVVYAGATAIGIGSSTALALSEGIVYGAVGMGLSALSAGLRGTAAGIQTRMATNPVEARRLLLGKVWTAGSSMGQPITYDASNKKCFMLIAIADHPCDAIEQVYVDGYPAQLGSYENGKGYQIKYTVDPITGHKVKNFEVGQPKFYIEFHMGGDGQAADSWMVSDLGPLGRWDAAAVCQNVCYARIYCYYDSDIFSGFPTFNFVVRGIPLYDPTKDSSVGGSGAHRWGNPSTYEWSGNFAVMAYNLSRGIYVGGNEFYGAFYSGDDVPLDFAMAAIQDCDEAVSLKSGSTEPRYHGGFEIEVTRPVRDALKTCQEGMAGRICTDQGQLLIYAGVAQTPIFTFTDDDMIIGGMQSYDPFAALNETKNIITGKFTDASQMFATVDAPPRRSADDITADASIPLVDALNRPQIQSGPTMQRVMEIERKRGRSPGVAVRTFGLSALNARVGQWVAGQSARWQGTKWFEILRSEPVIEDGRPPSVVMTLREANATLEAWVPANDELSGYTVWLPSGDPPDPLKATGITAAPLSDQGDDGSSSPGFSVTYSGGDDPTASYVVLRWRLPGSNVIHYVTSSDLSSGTIAVRGLAGDTTYEYSILISGILGRDAAWSDWYTVTTPAAVLPNGSVTVASLAGDVSTAISTASQNVQALTAALTAAVQQLVAADAGNAADIQQVSTALTSQTGSLQADYLARFGTVTTTLAAYAYAVQAVQAMFGNDYSAALLRMEVQTPPAGYLAKISLSASASVAGATGLGGIVILLKDVGGTIQSTIALIADQTEFLLPDGTLVGLITAGGWIVGDRIQKGSISTGRVYSLGDGITTKGAEDSTSAPPDGTEVAIGSGASVPYYDNDVFLATGIAGYETDPTASLVEVEARFVFRVQTGAGTATKAGIEYYTSGSWVFLPDSDDVVYTSNTNSLASLMPKAPLPAGTQYWRPRIYNTTGNTIWMRRMRAYETKLVK